MFSDIPYVVSEYLGENISQQQFDTSNNGKIYLYSNDDQLTNHNNKKNNNKNDNDEFSDVNNFVKSVWVFAILFISVPVAILLAFVGYRHRSLMVYQSTQMNDDADGNNNNESDKESKIKMI